MTFLEKTNVVFLLTSAHVYFQGGAIIVFGGITPI